MLTNIQINILVGCVILVLIIVSILQGHALEPKDLISASSYAVTALGFLLLIWDRWLWAWPIFHSWLSKRPNLRGTWRGELLSDYVDPVTHQKRSPIEVYLVIRQTNSSVDVRLFSTDSSSISLSGNIASDGVGVNTLIVTYRTEPSLFKRDKSPIGYGGMLLNIRGNSAYKLDGEYWTDRLTRGQLSFTMHSKENSHDFEQAARLKYQSLNDAS